MLLKNGLPCLCFDSNYFRRMDIVKAVVVERQRLKFGVEEKFGIVSLDSSYCCSLELNEFAGSCRGVKVHITLDFFCIHFPPLTL